jgi:tetratricopeptide (TPR) repeat protein
MNTLRTIFLGILLIGGLGACGTMYRVRSYPEGAKVVIQNVVSKEEFEIGETPADFEHLSKYGDGFLVKVSKEQFLPEEVFLSRAPGSDTTLQVNLKPGQDPNALAGNEDDKDKSKPEDKKKEEDELKNRIAVLERTFEIFKGAIFSPRLASGPASVDRRNTDMKVGLVNKAQGFIERRQFDQAEEAIDRLLEQDEYLTQGHVLKGTMLYMKGDYQAASRSWERALEIDPYQKLTRQYLVEAYKRMGREVPGDPEEFDLVDRSPASSPLQTDTLKLRLRNR